jgi:hypothetical protein
VTKTLKERAHTLSTTIGEFILLLHTPCIARIKEWNSCVKLDRNQIQNLFLLIYTATTSCEYFLWGIKWILESQSRVLWRACMYLGSRELSSQPETTAQTKKGFCSKGVCLPYDHTRLHHSDGGRVVHIRLPPRKKPYYSVPPSFKIRIEPIRAEHKKKNPFSIYLS